MESNRIVLEHTLTIRVTHLRLQTLQTLLPFFRLTKWTGNFSALSAPTMNPKLYPNLKLLAFEVNAETKAGTSSTTAS